MAANTTATMLLPNPLTPLAFLPPALADEFQVTSYVNVASLAIFLWDWLMSMSEEYKVLSRGSITLSKVVYSFSRVFALGFSVSTTVFQVAPVGNCQTLLYTIGAFGVLALMTNSLLFLIRVWAIYNHSKVITAIFGCLWLAVIGASFLMPFRMYGMHVGPTERCISTMVSSWLAVPIVTVAVNNTLVFVAISYRIISQSIHGDNWRVRAASFFRGYGVPRVARDLLQAGQLFYLVTLIMAISQVILVFGPAYKALLSVPGVALENAMACRVYRAVVLGFINDGTQGTTGPFILTTVVSGINISVSNDVALNEHGRDTKDALHHKGELATISSPTQQTEIISDRV